MRRKEILATSVADAQNGAMLAIYIAVLLDGLALATLLWADR
jgi:hypothetical protein